MKLHTYVAREVESTGKNKTTVLKEISKDSGVSLLTLQGVERGATLTLFSKAKAVSLATNEEVTVLELLDPEYEEIKPPVKAKKRTTKKKRAARR